MQSNAAGSQADLVNLLKYAEELLKGGDRIISDLSKDTEMAFYEHDVALLEGVSTDDADGIWLRVSRLGEIEAPEPPDSYRAWIAAGVSPALFDAPGLADTLLVQVSLEEASDFLEAELALPDDVMKPLGRKDISADRVDVLLRLERLPKFAVEFQTWLDGGLGLLAVLGVALALRPSGLPRRPAGDPDANGNPSGGWELHAPCYDGASRHQRRAAGRRGSGSLGRQWASCPGDGEPGTGCGAHRSSRTFRAGA